LEDKINTLNVQLNPICHLLALLEAHPIFHVSRIRVKNVEVAGNVARMEEDRCLCFVENN
jgi:hypothetical protein